MSSADGRLSRVVRCRAGGRPASMKAPDELGRGFDLACDQNVDVPRTLIAEQHLHPAVREALRPR